MIYIYSDDGSDGDIFIVMVMVIIYIYNDGGTCGRDCNVDLDFNEIAKNSKKLIPRNRNIAPSKSATFQYRFLVLLSICQGVSKLQNQLRGVLRCIQVDIFILSCFFFF